jgi:cytochrome bd ubiquinol oxidase subunit I
MGVLGFYLWRGRHVAFAKPGFSLALWIALVLTPLQIFLGDLHGRNTLEYQPIKVAAMEVAYSGRSRPPIPE